MTIDICALVAVIAFSFAYCLLAVVGGACPWLGLSPESSAYLALACAALGALAAGLSMHGISPLRWFLSLWRYCRCRWAFARCHPKHRRMIALIGDDPASLRDRGAFLPAIKPRKVAP